MANIKNSTTSEGFETNLIEVTNYIYSHKYWIALAAVACSAIVGIWSFFFSQTIYSSSASVIFQVSRPSPLENEASMYWAREAEIDNKLYVLTIFLQSNRYKEALAKEALGLDSITGDSKEMKLARAVLKRRLQVENITNIEGATTFLSSLTDVSVDRTNRVLRLNAYTDNPLLSQSLANLSAQTLVELNFQLVLKEMNSVVSFIEDQTEATRNHLNTLENELALIQQKEKILSVADTTARLDQLQIESSNNINTLKVQRATNEIWISEIQRSIEDFRKALSSGPDSYLYVMQLQKRLDLLFYQRSLLNQDRNIATIDKNEVDLSLNKTLEELQSSLKNGTQTSMDPWSYLAQLENNLTAARRQQAETGAKISALEKVSNTELEKYGTLPNTLKKITQVKRDIEQTSGLFHQLNSKLQETQIQKAGKANDLDVLNLAPGLGQPVGMSIWKKFVFSFLAGAFVLILALTLKYILIPTIRGRNDLRRAGAEVIAEIPYVRFSTTDSNVNGTAPLLLNLPLASDEAYAIRRARFNIQEKLSIHAKREKHDASVLTVCSASSKEGKSFVASNLAHSLSLAQFRVLLVDLDNLNPSTPRYFKLDSNTHESIEDSIVDGKFYFDKKSYNAFLDLVGIPRMERSTTDILETPILGDYLQSMRREYDVIIIDTPPIRNSLEALISSRYSDAMILVANQRASLRHDVLRAMDTLQETYKKRIFAVLNFSYDEVNASRRRIAS